MESGRVRNRRLYTDSIEVLDVTWNFTSDEYAAFRTFFIDELEHGALIFTMQTTEMTEDPEIVRDYTRDYAFLDATYSFTESDNLFTVQAALIIGIDSEEYTERNLILPEPEVDYPTCRETFSIAWDFTSGDILQIATSSAGPWYDYITPVQTISELATGRKTVTLNNDFGGTKYFRIRRTGGAAKTKATCPQASVVAAPTFVSLTNVTDSTHTLRKVSEMDSIYTPFSRIENEYIQPLDFYVEPKTRLEFNYGSGLVRTNVPSFTVPPGAELRWTTDNSDPILDMLWPPKKYEGIDYNAAVWRAPFACIIKARCFKDGCASPLVVVLVDKKYPSINTVWTVGDYGTQVLACTIGALVNGNVWYPSSGGGLCQALCGIPMNSDEVWDCLMPYARVQACADTRVADIFDLWDYEGIPEGGTPAFNSHRWVTYNYERVHGPHFSGLPDFPYAAVSCYRFRMTSLDGNRSTDWNSRPVLFENLVIDTGYVKGGGMSGPTGSYTTNLTAGAEWLLANKYTACEGTTVLETFPIAPGDEQAQTGIEFTVFDILVTTYEDVFAGSPPTPPPDTVPDFDDDDPDIPHPPPLEDPTYYYDDFETYVDGDASLQTLNGGVGWNNNWTIVSYTGTTGYDLWDDYADQVLLTTEDNEALPNELDKVYLNKGEGWAIDSYWTFRTDELMFVYKEDWEDYVDETVTPSTILTEGTGWGVDSQWLVVDYGAVTFGDENWESYQDGTIPIAGVTLDDGTAWGSTPWVINSY